MRHGTTTGYRQGCRDLCCRRAVADAALQRRNRQYLARSEHLAVSPLGTHRRIQALVALGWSLAEVSRRAGYHRSYLGQVLSRVAPMRRATAARVDAIYRELAMQRPPEETHVQRIDASRARRMAAQNGWPPPLAWDDIDDPEEQPDIVEVEEEDQVDEVVVWRILNGDWHLPANRAERLAVLQQWSGSTNRLDKLTGWNLRRDLQLTRNDNEVA